MKERKLICRSCGSNGLLDVLSLGKTPLADALLKEEQLDHPEMIVPLNLVFCPHCCLVQITESVSPEFLFCRNYPYYTSVSETLCEHFRQSAFSLIQTLGLDADSFVVEAASNDGYMLENFVARGIPVLGIEPAEGPAQNAQKSGIPTRQSFFTEKLAFQLREKESIAADLFLANNVLAHVPDLNGFVEGIRILMKDSGQSVLEVHYLFDLIDQNEFDTVYHQHLCYFSVTALDNLFLRHSLHINEVQRIPTYGGSLRLFVEHHDKRGDSVRRILEEEENKGVGELAYYSDFANRVKDIKTSISQMLREIKNEGKKIVGYGAPAKAATLLSFCGIGKEMLDYVVDISEYKQGLYLGGSHIPIYSPSKLLEDMPDYVFILAWNFSEEIMQQQAEYKNRGGRFIVPVPQPEIL